MDTNIFPTKIDKQRLEKNQVRVRTHQPKLAAFFVGLLRGIRTPQNPLGKGCCAAPAKTRGSFASRSGGVSLGKNVDGMGRWFEFKITKVFFWGGG